jgi:D-3-phosphoglycerate dehydrogenase / 2-oxoglutarate reductase
MHVDTIVCDILQRKGRRMPHVTRQQRNNDDRIVAFSRRLGSPGGEEARIEAAGGALEPQDLWSLEDIRANAKDASIVVLGAVEPFDREALEHLPHCSAIVRRGVGYDNIDIAAATDLGILVANVPGASVEEVSDHALALLLALERRVPRLNEAVRAGVWGRDPKSINSVRSGARRLSELCLGVVGYGRIGRALVRKASPLYGRIIVADPALSTPPTDPRQLELAAVDELLRVADHISLHAPLTAGTRHLLNATTLGRLRPGAVVVNTARGGLIDEEALLARSSAGDGVSFGLDVTEQEPLPADDPLLTAANVVLTGHSAASSTTASAHLRSRTVDAVVDLLEGRAPESIVNPEVLASPHLRTGRIAESS